MIKNNVDQKTIYLFGWGEFLPKKNFHYKYITDKNKIINKLYNNIIYIFIYNIFIFTVYIFILSFNIFPILMLIPNFHMAKNDTNIDKFLLFDFDIFQLLFFLIPILFY